MPLAVLVVLAVGTATTHRAPAACSTVDVWAIYLRDCVVCHGVDGTGTETRAVARGPRRGPRRLLDLDRPHAARRSRTATAALGPRVPTRHDRRARAVRQPTDGWRPGHPSGRDEGRRHRRGRPALPAELRRVPRVGGRRRCADPTRRRCPPIRRRRPDRRGDPYRPRPDAALQPGPVEPPPARRRDRVHALPRPPGRSRRQRSRALGRSPRPRLHRRCLGLLIVGVRWIGPGSDPAERRDDGPVCAVPDARVHDSALAASARRWSAPWVAIPWWSAR